MGREALLARTLVELADSLVDDFDVVELLTVLTDRCVEALDVSAAGLVLVTPGGDLRVVASSSEAIRVFEVFELQAEEGPSMDSYRTGRPVLYENLMVDTERWPRFAQAAVAAGFRSVQALPMRLRGVVIGALTLVRTDLGGLEAADVVAAQAFADVATIAILQHRAAAEAQLLTEQLHHALNSRIAIEQAKGVVAERAGVSVETAFSLLRAHARNRNRRLAEVARDVVAGDLSMETLHAAGSSHTEWTQ